MSVQYRGEKRNKSQVNNKKSVRATESDCDVSVYNCPDDKRKREREREMIREEEERKRKKIHGDGVGESPWQLPFPLSNRREDIFFTVHI